MTGDRSTCSLHEYNIWLTVAGSADEASVIIEIGEYLKEAFDRELENCDL